MMPTIAVSDPVLNDLKTLAEPFVDHEQQDVIKRLIHFYRCNAVMPSKAKGSGAVEGAQTFPPDSPPDMAFTRVKSFKMDGDAVVEKAALYWNPILFALVAKAAKKLGTEELKKHLLVN